MVTQPVLRENIWPSAPSRPGRSVVTPLSRRQQGSLVAVSPVVEAPPVVPQEESPAVPAPAAAVVRVPQDLLGMEEVAACLKISKTAVIRFCRQGDLPAVRIPGGFQVERRYVLAWLAEVGAGVRR